MFNALKNVKTFFMRTEELPFPLCLKVGDRVEVRDKGERMWEMGTVMEMDKDLGPRVQKDGYSGVYFWDKIREPLSDEERSLAASKLRRRARIERRKEKAAARAVIEAMAEEQYAKGDYLAAQNSLRSVLSNFDDDFVSPERDLTSLLVEVPVDVEVMEELLALEDDDPDRAMVLAAFDVYHDRLQRNNEDNSEDNTEDFVGGGEGSGDGGAGGRSGGGGDSDGSGENGSGGRSKCFEIEDSDTVSDMAELAETLTQVVDRLREERAEAVERENVRTEQLAAIEAALESGETALAEELMAAMKADEELLDGSDSDDDDEEEEEEGEGVSSGDDKVEDEEESSSDEEQGSGGASSNDEEDEGDNSDAIDFEDEDEDGDEDADSSSEVASKHNDGLSVSTAPSSLRFHQVVGLIKEHLALEEGLTAGQVAETAAEELGLDFSLGNETLRQKLDILLAELQH